MHLYEYIRAVLLHSGVVEREWAAGAGDLVVWPAAWDVAVLFTVHNRESDVARAIEEIARMVPVNSVFVVSDDSTDQTAEIAREQGAHVVETMGRLGPQGAFDAGMQAFRLAERFEYVLMLDVDTTLEPHFLEQAMPLFEDPAVTAVSGQVEIHLRDNGGIVTAYRARAYTVAGWTGHRPRTRMLPNPGRIYRASSIPEHQVTFCPSARLSTPQPANLAEYRRETVLWARENRRSPALLLFNAAIALAPLLAVLAAILFPAYWWVIPAAVILPDYAITAAVAVAQRESRFLLPGLAFPALRLLDALTVLGISGPPAEEHPWPQRLRPSSVLGWTLLIAAAGAVVARVGMAISTLPAGSVEPGLVDAAYGRITGLSASPVDTALTVTGLQLNAYASLASPFDRHASTLISAREMSVAAAVVLLASVVVIAAMLRVRPLVTTLCVAMVAVSGPVIASLVPVGPGVPAAAWTGLAAAVACAAIARPNGPLMLAGVLALLIALATAPILVVPLGVGAAAWFADKKKVWGVGIALAVTLGAVFALWQADFLDTTGVLTGNQRLVLLVVVVAAAVAGFLVSWLRPVAIGTAAGVLATLFAGDALVPVLIAAATVLLAVVIDDAVTRPQAMAKWIPAAVAVAGSVTGALMLPPTAGTAGTADLADHSGLSGWLAAELNPQARLVVPVGLWSDVVRDRGRSGLPAANIRQAGTSAQPEFVVTAGDGPGAELARFGTTKILAVGGVDDMSQTQRAKAGTQLADNFRLRTTAEVTAALKAGNVDMRAMAVLAELCRDHDVILIRTGKPEAEKESSLPDRVLTLSTTDDPAALRDWLTAQQEPYAPASTQLSADSVTVGWRLPASPDQSPR